MHAPSEDPADIWRVFRGLYAFLRLQEDDQNTVRLRGRMAGWSGELVSLPVIRRLRVQFPSPPSHATLPTNGASVAVIRYMRMTVTGRNINTRGYGQKLATTLTRPKTPITIIIITALLNSKRSKTTWAYVHSIYVLWLHFNYTVSRNRQPVSQSTSISRL